MGISRSPSQKVPTLGTPRKLSLPSLRRWAHQAPEADPSNQRLSARPGISRSSSSRLSEEIHGAPMPHFLKKGREDEYNTWIDLEWQQRERLVHGIQQASSSPYTRTHGPGDPLIRNRYANVEPFERNRIRLRVQEGGNDYINASPIVIQNRRYICTQGPKDTSVSHFYRMIADETSNLAVVVMLTQTHEAGREKCCAYWPAEDGAEQPSMRLYPDEGEEDDGFEGEVTLTSTSEDGKANCTIRRMRLWTRTRLRGGTPDPPWNEKEVIHLLFAGWPDFGIPEGDDRQALLELIRLSRHLNSPARPPRDSSFQPMTPDPGAAAELNPRTVHCSAGVGRSGTFIALDHLLTLLDAGSLDSVPDSADPVADTVDRLRQQRMMMVQSEVQLFFLYDVLREQWLARWRKHHR